MKELVFLLEELSAQAMLEGLLPKLLPQDINPRFIPFEGKQDLEKQLAKKIKGYNNRYASFIILRDQDSHPDCIALKTRYVELCNEAGRPDALVRLACRELESYYLADLAAVEKGLNLHGLVKKQGREKYRNPDNLGSPSEELKRLTRGRYQKLSGSRAIGPHLDLENRRSASFRNLIDAIRRMVTQLSAYQPE
ncbi:DUF4276 family protein [Desulfovibrio aminophilus]|uniref:DUF4276 family protein n=1 Tax=Desulfovibrio aminophilus TaxID=81425 RepID=UPI0009FBD7A0|nr:DUF4276 family protein [Desulfovibrio aminophilus]